MPLFRYAKFFAIPSGLPGNFGNFGRIYKIINFINLPSVRSVRGLERGATYRFRIWPVRGRPGYSVQPLCSLCLYGDFPALYHRDTENTEVAQRRPQIDNSKVTGLSCLHKDCTLDFRHCGSRRIQLSFGVRALSNRIGLQCIPPRSLAQTPLVSSF